MSDIVERLRDKHCCDDTCRCDEAAAEIERLRAALEEEQKNFVTLEDNHDRLWNALKAIVRYAGNAGDDYLADKARAALTAQPAEGEKHE